MDVDLAELAALAAQTQLARERADEGEVDAVDSSPATWCAARTRRWSGPR
ncbi:hypothetical protein [Acrocarpospora corrugata]|nr:hypothetical protein [Acrocarpospora corrugata]